MAVLEFPNLIGGKDILLSGKRFNVPSPFFPDYITSVSDSNFFDLNMSISKVKNSIGECRQFDFDQRLDILKHASKKMKFSKRYLEYVVKMTGMPISEVEKKLNDIKEMFLTIPHIVKKRVSIVNGKPVDRPIEDYDMLHFLEPVHGFVYAVTPGNDFRVTAFVSSWLVTLGLPGIFKASKDDMLVSKKIMETLIDSGYPSSALNLLCWDTSNGENKKLNFKLVDEAKVVWVFGDDNTVNNLLRFEEVNEKGVRYKIDHFSEKIVLKHASGRGTAICDYGSDIEKAVKIMVESSLEWPIGCNSLKSVFDASERHEELIESLKEKFEHFAKHTGNPLKRTTKVGYTDPKLLSFVFKRANDLKRLGIVELITGEIIDDMQATPLLLTTNDVTSEFLNYEYPAYILAVKRCGSFDDAVDELNESTGKIKRLVVSVFSHDKEKLLRRKLMAHHVKRFRHSTELDMLFHEGNDYLHRLTEPQIYRIE